MHRVVVVLTSAVVLGALTPMIIVPARNTVAAPVPTHLMPKVVDYFPAEVGARWVYESTWAESFEGEGLESVVTDVKSDGDARIVTTASVRGGKHRFCQTYHVSPAGLFDLESPESPLSSRSPVLQHPLKATDFRVDPMIHDAARDTAICFETVQVPAGTFETVMIETIRRNPCYYIIDRTWYAPGVGKVKHQRADVTEVLKSFTPGRK